MKLFKLLLVSILLVFVVLFIAYHLKFSQKSVDYSQRNDISPPSTVLTVYPSIEPTVIYPVGSTGYAISWPQCNKQYPTLPYDFGILGVTGGRSFTHNPCFQSEYKWALQAKYPPSFYINMDYPSYIDKKLIESFSCEQNNHKCVAYHYGYETAKDVYNYASSEHASSQMWWLDVQIISSWSNDKTINSQVILGAIDFFKAQNVKIGLSTTPYQWDEIAGDLQTGLPNWIPGMPDKDKAQEYCTIGKSYSGGYIQQLAYVADDFERVYSCGK